MTGDSSLYARVETWIGRANISLDGWPDRDELLHSRCSRLIVAGLELALRLLQSLIHRQRQSVLALLMASPFTKASIPFLRSL